MEKETDQASAVAPASGGEAALARQWAWRRLLRVSASITVVLIAVAMVILGPDPFFIGIGLLILIGVVLTRWKTRIGAILILVPSIVALLFATGDVIFVATHPIAFYDLSEALLSVLGIVGAVNLIAAIATLLEGWVPAIGSARASLVVGLLGVLGVLVIAGIGAPAKLGYGNASASSGDIRLEMKDFKYTNESLDSAQAVSVYITNSDPTSHTFTIDGSVDQVVPANSQGRVTITLKPGQYHYYCSVPGHSSTMHGTLTVR